MQFHNFESNVFLARTVAFMEDVYTDSQLVGFVKLINRALEIIVAVKMSGGDDKTCFMGLKRYIELSPFVKRLTIA